LAARRKGQNPVMALVGNAIRRQHGLFMEQEVTTKLVCLAESRQDKTRSKALQYMAAFISPSEWKAFALSGRGMMCARINPGRCPGLVAICPFRALIAVWNRVLTSET